MKNFKTNDVVIRKFKMSDAEQMYSNLLEDKSENLTTKDEIQRIIKSAIIEFYTEEPIWAVEEKKTNTIIGTIKVKSYSEKNKFCNLSWKMYNKSSNINLMQQALNKVMNYLFLKRNVELIESSYYEQNALTGQVLDNIGMTKEAVLRNRRLNTATNKKENFVIYSINAEEFCKVNG